MRGFEHINAYSYRSFINGSSLAVIHFWAEWDAIHLKVQSEILTALCKVEIPVRYAKWDTDRADDFPLLREFNICNLPTLFFYRSGQLLTRRVGLCKADRIVEIINKIS